ncbi:unnamed protein product, partial [Amoebophrya sp. A120]
MAALDQEAEHLPCWCYHVEHMRVKQDQVDDVRKLFAYASAGFSARPLVSLSGIWVIRNARRDEYWRQFLHSRKFVDPLAGASTTVLQHYDVATDVATFRGESLPGEKNPTATVADLVAYGVLGPSENRHAFEITMLRPLVAVLSPSTTRGATSPWRQPSTAHQVLRWHVLGPHGAKFWSLPLSRHSGQHTAPTSPEESSLSPSSGASASSSAPASSTVAGDGSAPEQHSGDPNQEFLTAAAQFEAPDDHGFVSVAPFDTAAWALATASATGAKRVAISRATATTFPAGLEPRDDGIKDLELSTATNIIFDHTDALSFDLPGLRSGFLRSKREEVRENPFYLYFSNGTNVLAHFRAMERVGQTVGGAAPRTTPYTQHGEANR